MNRVRAALTRELGVETNEIGLTVESRQADLGGISYTILLFDQAAGGAGFSPRAVDLLSKLIEPMRALLDCKSEGCDRACSACVLTPDLREYHDLIDRRAALEFLDLHLWRLLTPDAAEKFVPDASFSDALADELLAGTGPIVVWSPVPDITDLLRGSFRTFVSAAQRVGRPVTLVLPDNEWAAMDEATRLGLRDFATRFDLELRRGNAPSFSNGAIALAALPDHSALWASRDAHAYRAGPSWGIPNEFPVVRGSYGIADIGEPVHRSDMELHPDAAFFGFTGDVDGPTLGFGERLLQTVEPLLQRIDAWKPGHLIAATYFDRYLKSPLTVRLALDFISAARSALSGDDPIQVELVSEPYRADGRYSDGQPWKITHDWRDDNVREAVVHSLGDRLGLDLSLSLRRDQHARQIELLFNTGTRAVLVFDQGFGSWSPPSGISVRFDFNGDPVDQAIKLLNANVLIHGPTQPSYIVAHRR